MVTNPSVSVVIATYNRSSLLIRAIESVLKQTYKDFEIIVIDDGSTDQTREVVAAYSGRVAYFYQDNAGLSAVRNRGIQEAKGRWIAWLDDDDQWHPNKLSIQVDKIKQLPEPGFLWCNGMRGGTSVRNPADPSGFVESMGVIYCQPSSWLMSCDIFKKIGGFDTSYKSGMDIAFVRKARMNGIQIYYQNDLLVVWEDTPGHMSTPNRQGLIHKEQGLHNLSDYFKKDRVYFYKYLYTLGKDALRFGDKKRARKYILKAFLLKPWKLELLARYFHAL
jgi:glycosyltransferase involved in cell wall biosynthesis